MSDKTVAELMALYRHTIAAYGGASIAELAKREAEFEQAIRRAVDSAALSAAPAQEMTEELWVIVRESVLDVGNGDDVRTGGRPELGYALLKDAATFPSQEAARTALKAAQLPLGWVLMPLSRLLPDLAADRASRLPELTDEQIVSAMLAGSGGDPVWMRLTNKQMIAAGRAVEALVRGKT